MYECNKVKGVKCWSLLKCRARNVGVGGSVGHETSALVQLNFLYFPFSESGWNKRRQQHVFARVREDPRGRGDQVGLSLMSVLQFPTDSGTDATAKKGVRI
jgi:hypothetical protein